MMPVPRSVVRSARLRTIPVIQGEFRVASDPTVRFSTVLGSCVSVCLYDPDAHLGGMNHYLLPDGPASGRGEMKYGAMAIELLINEMLKSGAVRSRLVAKLYGGASMQARLGDIGARNAAFGREFLRREGFRILEADLGGTQARRLVFYPGSGEVQMSKVGAGETKRIASVERPVRPVARSDVTLF